MNEFYCIKNEIDEYGTQHITGYYKTFAEALDGLRKKANWFSNLGTGRIYKISFNTKNDIMVNEKLVYKKEN